MKLKLWEQFCIAGVLLVLKPRKAGLNSQNRLAYNSYFKQFIEISFNSLINLSSCNFFTIGINIAIVSFALFASHVLPYTL